MSIWSNYVFDWLCCTVLKRWGHANETITTQSAYFKVWKWYFVTKNFLIFFLFHFEITSTIYSNSERSEHFLVKFRYSEKTTKFWKISQFFLLSNVKYNGRFFFSNVVAFSENLNLTEFFFNLLLEVSHI